MEKSWGYEIEISPLRSPQCCGVTAVEMTFILLFPHITAFVVEVLAGEEGELDLVGSFVDSNASDVGV